MRKVLIFFVSGSLLVTIGAILQFTGNSTWLRNFFYLPGIASSLYTVFLLVKGALQEQKS